MTFFDVFLGLWFEFRWVFVGQRNLLIRSRFHKASMFLIACVTATSRNNLYNSLCWGFHLTLLLVTIV